MLTIDQENTMLLALTEAKKAQIAEEVPIGAVVLYQNKVIAKAYNRVIQNHDPSAHAEIIALREAGQLLKNYRLNSCQLYVTLEPCPMCWFSIIESRLSHLYFGAYRNKQPSFCKSNSRISVLGGILEEESSFLLKSFFQAKRSLTRLPKLNLCG